MATTRLVPMLKRSLVWLALLIASVISIAPLAWMILSSLKPRDEVLAYPPTLLSANFGTFENYQSVATATPLFRMTLNSLFVSTSTTLLTILLAALTAYGLVAIEWPGRRFLFTAILATMMVPFFITMIPLFIIVRSLGMYDNYLGVILPAIGSPLAVYIMRQRFLTVPRELCDAARVDGASELTIFWQVMLPLATPAMVVVGVITFSQTWSDFLWPLIVLQSPNLFTLQLGLLSFFTMFNTDWGRIMAFSAISILPILVLFLVFQRQFIEGMTSGALKE